MPFKIGLYHAKVLNDFSVTLDNFSNCFWLNLSPEATNLHRIIVTSCYMADNMLEVVWGDKRSGISKQLMVVSGQFKNFFQYS